MNALSLLQTARRERDHLMMAAPPPLQSSLVSSLLALHRVLSSSETSAVDAGLDHVRRACRAAGRRLEDLLDAPLAAAPPIATLVSQFVEPDLLPLCENTLAGLVGRCGRPSLGGAKDPDPGLVDVGDAVAVVVEEDLGPALLALGLFGFEVPRPSITPFDPRRHQLVERQMGPRDVVVDLQRFARVARGGRLLKPALVVVGDGT